jgi:predicted esterase
MTKNRTEAEMQPQKFDVNLKIPISYMHLNPGPDKPVFIFLHGFADSAKSFLKRAFKELPTNVEILAINGPFPLPQRKENHWKHAYAWYFVDLATKEVYIHPQVAAGAVNDLLKHLKLEERPKILVGFSQGGFFVPFLLPELKNVKHIFTIGCAYRPEDYPAGEKYKLDALHGEEDEVVSFKGAAESFKALQKNHIEGTFTAVPGLGHTMNEEAKLWLKKKIDEVSLS